MSLTYADPQDWGFRFFQSEKDSTPRFSSTDRVENSDTYPTQTVSPAAFNADTEVTGYDEILNPRYAGLDLRKIQRELSADDFQIFMETVGSIEMPLDWTIRGKSISWGLPGEEME